MSINYYAYSADKTFDVDQETMVFIHGATMEHSVWLLQSRYFANHGYNVLAVDLPAHGLSNANALHDIEAMADWVNSVVADNNCAACHLVGHSMGALIALEAASRYNHTTPLKSVSLLGFSYPMKVNDKLLNAAKYEPHKAYSMMTQFSNFSKIGGEPNPGFWSPGIQISTMENADDSLVFNDLNACNNYRNGKRALANINSPILILSGADDKMAPAKYAKEIADSADNARFIAIKNCGHSLLAEQPDTIREKLKAFLISL